MGLTVLYIAFGVVALWLLGEVLLQYKARLRWRLVAFAGFLGVVLGVLSHSVVVIGVGAAAFVVGQTYVTLSFRRGFEAGWAVNRPGADGSKRRRGEPDYQDPTLEVSDLEPAEGGYDDRDAAYGSDNVAYGPQDADYDRDDVFTPGAAPQPAAAETTTVYEPQPMPDDTGSYGIYGTGSAAHAAAGTDPAYATAGQPQDQTYGYDYSGYGQQQYGYDATGQQQYANYSDPYIGTQTYGGTTYDPAYGQQGYGQDQYGTGTYGETPAGGVWVPQQRTDENYGGEPPQEQPYPYQGNGQQQGNGYDEQHRF
ncbi:SCO2102 family sporulation regulator [Streptomyces brasiliensis]|uniref:Uncharacterized protein n=1 Tax=Streptomyces brasiliensis TaxID=1954 RepID=A0A917KSN7_9ACTN|nr:hypothetical protein [Streptomyces brasiliensis]GGJ25114.1 hypothetical protein GCM10010121_040220 [Streptomyces brasiliensis]